MALVLRDGQTEGLSGWGSLVKVPRWHISVMVPCLPVTPVADQNAYCNNWTPKIPSVQPLFTVNKELSSWGLNKLPLAPFKYFLGTWANMMIILSGAHAKDKQGLLVLGWHFVSLLGRGEVTTMLMWHYEWGVPLIGSLHFTLHTTMICFYYNGMPGDSLSIATRHQALKLTLAVTVIT